MKNLYLFLSLLIISVILSTCDSLKNDYLKISADEYRNKMKAAWIGQMAGVGWGLPTEFDYTDKIIPEKEVPVWNDNMVNQQGNDDLYVEMTFLSSMDNYGIDVPIRQAGIDFANTGYTLWAANKAGRENLRFGIAPPESSHPDYSNNCDDIDYQIEADYSGIIAPGMPNVPVQLGEKFGRLMNYGDGLYGGQFVGAMYSAAYFESDIEKIINSGLQAIPEQSLYSQCVRDVINWYKENPDNWKTTWQKIENKYHTFENQPYAEKSGAWIPIDAKLNGAYIVMGLLYGHGNMDSTIVISMRGGKDSDCNPSNAAGVLGTTIGFDRLDNKFKAGLDYEKLFSYSQYNLNDLFKLCERFTREYIIKNGGKIEKDAKGNEIFYIRRDNPTPSPFHPSYDPAPANPDNRYTTVEMEKIKAWSVHHFAPLFTNKDVNLEIRHCGKEVSPELIEWNNRSDVLSTVPMSRERGVKIILSSNNPIPAGKRAFLEFSVGNNEDKSWKLRVREKGNFVIDTLVSSNPGKKGWMDFRIDISDYAGQENLNLTILADQEGDEPAKNYWSGFDLQLE